MRQLRVAGAVKEREVLAGRKAAAWRSGVLEGRRRRGSVAVAMDGARNDGEGERRILDWRVFEIGRAHV